MKLYEVQVRARGVGWFYTYHKNTVVAKKAFNAANRKFKKLKTPVQIVANRIEVKNSFTADEIILLLSGSAPGDTECAMTPMDLISNRVKIKETVHNYDDQAYPKIS